MQNMTNHLDEGIKAIKVRQKHIRMADHSELGWAVDMVYEDDELVLCSDNEKRIYRAEGKAESLAKRKLSGTANASKKRLATSSGADIQPAQTSQRTTVNNTVKLSVNSYIYNMFERYSPRSISQAWLTTKDN